MMQPRNMEQRNVGNQGLVTSALGLGCMGMSDFYAPEAASRAESIATIRRAHAVHPLSALETEYSLWSREVEDEILPALRELGIGMLAYGALSRGLFGGGITNAAELGPGDFRHDLPRFQGARFASNL